jgi:hypothetical protein
MFILNLATFYLGSMLIISLATAGTVITLHIHKQGDYRKPLPRIVKIIFFDWIAKALFLTIRIRNNKSKQEELEFLLARKHNESIYRSEFQIGKLSKKNNNKTSAKNNFHTIWSPEKSPINGSSAYITRLREADKSKSFVKNDSPTSNKFFIKMFNILNKIFEENELKNDLEDYYDEIQSEWAQLAKIIDITFAFTFVSFTAGIMFVFIYFYVTY